MLTADLVRATRRKGELRPRYIDTSKETYRQCAEDLCRLFEQHKDRKRSELDDAMKDQVGDQTYFQIARGLAKLLDDRSEWETVAPVDPVDIRRTVFELAADHHPVGRVASKLHPVSRADVLAMAAAKLDITAEEVEAGLYADLRAEQRMVKHRKMTPDKLLHRYNLAQAQALLFKAVEMRVDVYVSRPSRLRQLFRYLKFFQLMHRAERIGKSRWRITIDGPLSLFSQSQRYGLQMANLLPAILLTDEWALEADIQWEAGKPTVPFRVTPEDGLVSHYRSRGTYITDEERIFMDRITKHSTPWEAKREAVLIDLGGKDILVPDLVLVHSETGKKVFLEIVGFWRRGYLERRAELLREYGPPNLVLCVSRRLKTEKGKADLPDDNVVDFAEVISVRKVVDIADRLAV